MNPVEWYYARENKQVGPVSALELKRLATAGELRPEDLVWREGMTEWSLARNVRGLFDGEGNVPVPMESEPSTGEPVAAASAVPQSPKRHLFDVLLGTLRTHFAAHFIETTAKLFRTCGSYGLLAAIGLTAGFALVMTAKTGHLDHLLWGVIGVVVISVLQYVSGRSCKALDELGGTTTGTLSSSTLPDCLALLSLAAGVTGLLVSIAGSIAASDYTIILFGVTMFLILGYLAALALNLPVLGISIATVARGSDEAIGLLKFLVTALTRLVPVAFGAGVTYSALVLAYACGQAFSGASGPKLAADTAAVASRGFWWFGALPLVAYVALLLVSLIVDLWRAVLMFPAKLDKLTEKNDVQPGEQGG